jgi:SAM-dependent methyltransferase
MTGTEANSFLRYLAAKKSVDDRALNRQVWQVLGQALAARPPEIPLTVLEVGCGIGTMAERLLDWGKLSQVRYTGIDLSSECLDEARRRLRLYAVRRGLAVNQDGGGLRIRGQQLDLTLDFEAGDFFTLAGRGDWRSSFDLVLAHAFLDLVDLDEAVPQLLALLKPGGWFSFTLNFDGATVFQPVIEPELDRRIIQLYHRTMAREGPTGGSSEGSTTGRRLFGVLLAAGAEVLAAGGADWVVFPQGGGYPEDEAYFLHFLIHTISQALAGGPHLDQRTLEAWVEKRHTQVDSGELLYIAHNLDYCGRVP